MQLEHRFDVEGPFDEVWKALLDLETFIRCFPGASMEKATARSVDGVLQIKLGPVGLRYTGTARRTETDRKAHRIVLTAEGTDERSQSSVDAAATITLGQRDETVEVRVLVDLRSSAVVTTLAQGTLRELGDELWHQFAECLSDTVVPERLLPAEDQPREPLPDRELPPEFKPGSDGGSFRDEIVQLLEAGEAGEAEERPSRSTPQPQTPPEIDLRGPLFRRFRRKANPVRWARRLRRG